VRPNCIGISSIDRDNRSVIGRISSVKKRNGLVLRGALWRMPEAAGIRSLQWRALLARGHNSESSYGLRFGFYMAKTLGALDCNMPSRSRVCRPARGNLKADSQA
jgi:hypothetical protein